MYNGLDISGFSVDIEYGQKIKNDFLNGVKNLVQFCTQKKSLNNHRLLNEEYFKDLKLDF
jgi:hypothetical protein